MIESIESKHEDIIEELMILGFDELPAGNLDKKNEFVNGPVKIKLVNDGCIFYRWDVSLYRKDNEFYTEENRVQGFNIVDIKKIIDELTKDSKQE